MPHTVAPPFVPQHLEDLICLADICQEPHVFRDCATLGDLYEPLCALQRLVGMGSVKRCMFEYIMLRLQQVDNRMNHMVLAGPPGCGKTTVCTIIARILCRLGVCETENIVFGTQANMIAGYLGQTASKTEKLIRKAFGGVLVIDEASSLADGRSSGSSDSFSKSCLDTLNRMLSEHGDRFVCILAGYKEEIYRDILSVNPGMRRRFSVHLEVDPYTGEHLRQIVRDKIQERGFTCVDIPPATWFHTHLSSFQNTGGDCQILVDKSIICRSLEVFGELNKKELLRQNILDGHTLMTKHYVQEVDNIAHLEMYR
jgi:SpoVK/Ycf46/Vps4 family AAA+-type ATPase